MRITITGRWFLIRFCKVFLAVLICSSAMACSSARDKTDTNKTGYRESGKASYYAMKFQGRKTASGEPYDQSEKTAAHRNLPFGTILKVTNTRNGKSVTVRVNDRGPFVKGRIVDLSSAAFSRIADLKTGVIDVQIEIFK